MNKLIQSTVAKAIFVVSTALISMAAAASPTDDLWQAVAIDNARSLPSVLKDGVDVNVRNAKGQLPLLLALQLGSNGVAAQLADAPGLNVNATNQAGETALMIAALKGQLGVMKRLIERGAKVHLPGWSPIHYAASGTEPKAVQLLLDAGAPVDPLAGGNVTPLMMAAMYGAEGCVDLLLAKGANRSLRNSQGETAADRAAKADRDFLVKRLQALP